MAPISSRPCDPLLRGKIVLRARAKAAFETFVSQRDVQVDQKQREFTDTFRHMDIPIFGAVPSAGTFSSSPRLSPAFNFKFHPRLSTNAKPSNGQLESFIPLFVE